MKKLVLVCTFGRYEYRSICSSLDDVARTIDDWSTDFCENNDLSISWYNPKGRMRINVFTEEID